MTNPIPRPPARRAMTMADVATHYRRLLWGLVSVLGLVVIVTGGILALPYLTTPRGEYLDTRVWYVSTPGGQEPACWIVRLRVAGQVVEAQVQSEAEALAVKAMMRR